MSQDDALTIYQGVLDLMGQALLAGDEATFLHHVFLPHHIVTEDQTIGIDTYATGQRHFNGFVNALRAQRVDSYVRVAKSATFLSPDRILGQHETFITSGGKLVSPRFENEMELLHRDGVWGAVRTQHFTRYVSWPDVLPRGRS